MLTFAALYLLALLDCAFASYRSAGGRNATISKGLYPARNLLFGALTANIPIAITGFIAFLMYRLFSQPAELLASFIAAGNAMLQVYEPYSAIVLTTLLIRVIPCVDTRSLAMVVVLGPLTLLRPLVAIAGVAYGAVVAWRLEVTITLLPTVLSMLLMQSFFDRLNRYPDFSKFRKE